ncbi:ferric-chelate reductase [Grosmannia clavigera kw1407]|uniref:ferric-chelate reductase (NADPH) n=1 Tax=Grosmannia clavigera (strain kw1407 / UAMH 11150) TaxID=655863 RepID=F0XAL5_GROCL|nr:ferric-chelate reductase [Grosmannia clavigera kw1407]EFX05653.1 ferric-chelate reductase [Grosmannia clavigera kw1407]
MSSNSSAAAAATVKSTFNPAVENQLLADYLYYICAAGGGVVLLWSLAYRVMRRVRTVTSLNNDTQRYYAEQDSRHSWLKRNVVYAPVSRKRHNREIQMSSAINVGTLPTRLQLIFLLGYLATNVAYCVIHIPFDSVGAAAQLRNRTGILATINMVPLFLMAGRNNPLITLLGMSFDTFNLLHRWFGRIVALEALTHTLSYVVVNAQKEGFSPVMKTIVDVPFLKYGLISTLAMLVIGFQAMSPLRHAAYETFKILHIALAAVAVMGLYYHLHIGKYKQISYLYSVIALWAADRTARFLRVMYNNVGNGGTQTLVEALPGNACRVTVTMARPWTFKPGQHAYLYIPSVGYWQSHPFSVAWSEEAEVLEDDKLAMNRQEVMAMRKTSMSFVIRGRTGMTGKLYKKASEATDGRWHTKCMVEGPYGGVHNLHSYGTVMLFAGGVGITQAVPHVRDLVTGYANGTVAARKVVLVWTIQTPEHLEWIRPWMTEILAMEKRRDVLRIMLFVSRPRSTKEIHSPSATVQMFPGRPNISTLLGHELENQVGTVGVTVCGPGALSDEVRLAVRDHQYEGSIEFIEEAFSW